MEEHPLPWKHGVVLVCMNERVGGRPSCGRARGTELKSWLKETLRAEGGPGAECRVLNSTCLDICSEKGVAVAILPGEEVLVVEPQSEREALKQAVQARFGGVKGRLRDLLRR